MPDRRGAAGEGQRVEHEHERGGALCYLAAWDARRAKVFDRCAPKDGIEPFDRLVERFMSQHPYSAARRVFLILDNGSAHRGRRSIDRLKGAWPNLTVVHTPVHAQPAEPVRNLLLRRPPQGRHPNDFEDLDALEARLLAFGRRYEQIAAPFQWRLTREDLHKPLARTESTSQESLAA